MRQYPSDSPEALTRIVALALMADGIIDPSELRLLKDQEILSRLGLDPDSFDRVFYEFCTDMLNTAQRTSSGQLQLDGKGIKRLLDEVTDPVLQKSMLRTIMDITHADQQLAGSEAVLITEALKCWSLDLHQIADLTDDGRTPFDSGKAQSAHV
jgi:hypothetical protein